MSQSVYVDNKALQIHFGNASRFEVPVHDLEQTGRTEIFARKLKKRIMALRTNKRRFVKDLKEIYEKTWDDLQNQNKAYDKATDFSNVEFAQRTWQNFIKESLVLYIPYQQQTIRFPIKD